MQGIVHAVQRAGGVAYLVGGCVRDGLLGLKTKDFDLEVFGIGADQLERVLGHVGQVDCVGKQFGVFKIRGTDIDVALPRREIKTGAGHRGFSVLPDPMATIQEAAARRDFTVNALYYNPVEGHVRDLVGGLEDLRFRRLRHVSDAFREDPLRVLRGMQMVARFDLNSEESTLAVCRDMGIEDLPVERIGEEFFKLICRGDAIAKGLAFLRAVGWVRFFPELNALIGCPQDPQWHPEGDVWEHTGHCLDAFARERTGDVWEDWIVGLAVLCHDLGKPVSTTYERGRWRSPRHEDYGLPIAESFLKRLTRQKSVVDEVLPLVANHMRPHQLFSAQAGDSAVRRLAVRVDRIDRLIRVCRADKQGRPPLVADDFSDLGWLAEASANLSIGRSRPSPIILGRHLIAQGLLPSERFGLLLRDAYEAQLDGAFSSTEEGIRWLKSRIDQPTA